jgi:antitoxin (DNA-binding transcriptional repressor) of toxin-antitoxin stability system
MQEMAISQFKAQCLAVLEKVRVTGQPLLVTRFGKPVAQVDPPPSQGRKHWFGALKGTATIKGDLTLPLGGKDWEALS